MSKQKLAIIGANAPITMLINKAKDMGYETHVFAWKCGDPGEEAADYFYPISIDDKDSILKKCRELGVAGVCSITSDFAAPTVSYVARELGLTCNPEITGEIARNKYKMRCAFKEAGLFTPVFFDADSSFNVDEYKGIDFPVIVKPTDRWSSKGVTRVDCIEELKKAVDYAISESFNNKAIIESFMEGPEFSAECICFSGDRRILAITQKETTGYPHYIETGHFQPANITEEQYETINDTVIRALEALKIENGAAHAEFRILDSGEIGIIEIGARMGGDCIGTDLTPISTGMDYIKMVIDVACGKKPCFDIITTPSPVKVKFIMNKTDLDVYETIKKQKPSLLVRAAEIDEDFEREVIDSSTRHGYYIIASY